LFPLGSLKRLLFWRYLTYDT